MKRLLSLLALCVVAPLANAFNLGTYYQELLFTQYDALHDDAVFAAEYVATSPSQTAYYNGQAVALGAASVIIWGHIDSGTFTTYLTQQRDCALYQAAYYASTANEVAYWNGVAQGYAIALVRVSWLN